MSAPKLLTRAQAAKRLGISVATLRRRHERVTLKTVLSPLGEHLFWELEVSALAAGRPLPTPQKQTPALTGDRLNEFRAAVERGLTSDALKKRFGLTVGQYRAALRSAYAR